MSFKVLATLALVASLAAAKPVNAPETLPAYSKRDNNNGNKGNDNGNRGNGNGKGNDFSFIDGFNNFNQQQQVVQIQQQNLQIINNGRQQQVIEQVQQILIVDQSNNGFNNNLNNLFRKSNFQNKNQKVTTVLLVVKEVQISIDDGRGNKLQQQMFAQQVIVANRGQRQTETVMIFDSRTLIAQDIIGNNNNNKNNKDNKGRKSGVAGATDAAKLPTKTAGIQLLDTKPTWSVMADDPAATLDAIWQGALQDLQNNANDQQDNQVNDQAAAQVKAKLDEEKKAQEAQKAQDEQKAQEAQKAQDEQAAQDAQKAQDALAAQDAQKNATAPAAPAAE